MAGRLGGGVAAGLAALLLAAAPAWPHRPMATEETGVLEPGQGELELSVEHLRDPEDERTTARAAVNVGLLPGVQAGLTLAGLVVDPDDGPARAGPGDTFVSLKYRLLEETPETPALLASLTLRLPTGSSHRRLGDPGADVAGLLAASKTVGPLMVTANAGYLVSTAGRALDLWLLAGSVEYRAAPAWILGVELVAALGARGAADEVVARGGVSWALSARLALDAAVAHGLTGASQDLSVAVGATLGF